MKESHLSQDMTKTACSRVGFGWSMENGWEGREAGGLQPLGAVAMVRVREPCPPAG